LPFLPESTKTATLRVANRLQKASANKPSHSMITHRSFRDIGVAMLKRA
jgi:hypothetical protein